MFRFAFYSLILSFLILSTPTRAQNVIQPNSVSPTKAEAEQAKDIAKRFTRRFFQTGSLAPLLDEFYLSDFIERFKRGHTQGRNGNVLFPLITPGLIYDYSAVTQGTPDDWRRLYVSANDFFILPVVAALKHAKENKGTGNEFDFDLVKFYSPPVVALVRSNPNLADFIGGPTKSKPISTPDELRNTTATLDAALKIIREKEAGNRTFELEENELTRIFEKASFKPELEIHEELLGFPAKTRLIRIITPLALELVLARDDRNRLKVIYANLIP